jgi:hypothetical protein
LAPFGERLQRLHRQLAGLTLLPVDELAYVPLSRPLYHTFLYNLRDLVFSLLSARSLKLAVVISRRKVFYLEFPLGRNGKP